MEIFTKKKIAILVVIFFISISGISAQEFELAWIEYAYYPAANMNEQDAKDKNTFNELLVFGKTLTQLTEEKKEASPASKHSRERFSFKNATETDSQGIDLLKAVQKTEQTTRIRSFF